MLLGIFGPWQLIVGLLIPAGIFLLGYYIGQKSGYIKRVRETERKGD